MRLNKMKALRCGTCDTVWQQCYDRNYVHTQTSSMRPTWTYTGWQEETDLQWQGQRQPSKSPRAKRGKSPRKVKKAREELVPPFDPPWNSKQASTAPQTDMSGDPSTSSGNAEQQLQSLVTRLKEKEEPLSPEEVEKIIAETTTKAVTSKNMHQAVKKLDHARQKFQSAQKERQNLHAKWTAYIEESIKRWQAFGEDFGKKDQALEEKVNQAKTAMQSARENLDKIKELHAKQDDAFLADVTDITSDLDEDMKVETAERIQKGIETMVSSLEQARVRAPEPNAEEAQANKKPRLDAGNSGPGSAALQPFGGPNK